MRSITKTTALKLSLFAMASVIIVEAFAGISTRSLALVSDAAHATFDALSTLILLVTTSLSMKPADEDHTYGHGKFESLGALIGGIILLFFAVGIASLAVYRLSTGAGKTDLHVVVAVIEGISVDGGKLETRLQH